MKALIVGLGSMGKRRIRCLKSLGHEDILAYDLREDRRAEAEKLYQVKTLGKLDSDILSKTDIIIISTPPNHHNQYIKLAIENKKPAFVEASVILEGLKELDTQARKQKVLIAPSCTLRFHPAVKDIKSIVAGGKYGKVTNFTYHSGQYLPDWHPWEMVKDFYVGNKETGGCREIVPFELTWLVDVVGFPNRISGVYGKTMDVGADIDDTYLISMSFGRAFGSMTVDVVSRYAIRSLILNMEQGQILWRWDDTVVKLYDAAGKRWIDYNYPQGQSVGGYNQNIDENMYIEELATFIKAANGESQWPNSLDEDIKVLELLVELEGGTHKK